MSGSKKIYKIADGEVMLWVDGGIHLKTSNTYNDPVELSEKDALELLDLLKKLLEGNE